MGNQVARNEEVVWQKIGDEIVAIGNDGLLINVLNKTAAYIWELCDGTRGPDEIAACLCERFEVELEEATADVLGILGKFEKFGLLRKAAGVRS
jgi:hypothetical protein